MTRTRLERPLISLFLVLLWLGSPAFAGKVTLNSVKVTLTPARKVETVTVRNDGERPMTIQVKSVSWSQDDQGKDQTAPSDELFIMPRVFVLPAKEERPVRIGSDRFPEKVEKAYRIYFTEVPDAAGKGKSEVSVAISIGIPAFVQPPKAPAPAGKITGASAARGKLAFAVENPGPVHLVMTSIKLTGKDSAGSEVCSGTIPRSFVMAQNRKGFTWEIPRESCSKVASLSIEAELDNQGGALRETLLLSSPACGD